MCLGIIVFTYDALHIWQWSRRLLCFEVDLFLAGLTHWPFGRCHNNLKSVILEPVSWIDILNECYITQLMIFQHLFGSWPGTARNLSQCWPKPVSLYGITRPHWVNHYESLLLISWLKKHYSEAMTNRKSLICSPSGQWKNGIALCYSSLIPSFLWCQKAGLNIWDFSCQATYFCNSSWILWVFYGFCLQVLNQSAQPLNNQKQHDISSLLFFLAHK